MITNWKRTARFAFLSRYFLRRRVLCNFLALLTKVAIDSSDLALSCSNKLGYGRSLLIWKNFRSLAGTDVCLNRWFPAKFDDVHEIMKSSAKPLKQIPVWPVLKPVLNVFSVVYLLNIWVSEYHIVAFCDRPNRLPSSCTNENSADCWTVCPKAYQRKIAKIAYDILHSITIIFLTKSVFAKKVNLFIGGLKNIIKHSFAHSLRLTPDNFWSTFYVGHLLHISWRYRIE